MTLTVLNYCMAGMSMLLLFVCGVLLGLAFRAPDRAALRRTRAAVIVALAAILPLCVAAGEMWDALNLP